MNAKGCRDDYSPYFAFIYTLRGTGTQTWRRNFCRLSSLYILFIWNVLKLRFYVFAVRQSEKPIVSRGSKQHCTAPRSIVKDQLDVGTRETWNSHHDILRYTIQYIIRNISVYGIESASLLCLLYKRKYVYEIVMLCVCFYVTYALRFILLITWPFFRQLGFEYYAIRRQ